MRVEDLEHGKYIAGRHYMVHKEPPWLDKRRFRNGQKFFHKFSFSVLIGWYCTLITGLSLPRFLDALVATNLSETPSKAFKRYVDTFMHLFKWHTSDVFEEGSVGYQSINSVRSIHEYVCRYLSDKKPSTLPPLNQLDMALVQAGFISAPIIGANRLGFSYSQQEILDYAYFWRCIGYLLGIDDEFNVCSRDLEDITSFCVHLRDSILKPELAKREPKYEKMADALTLGFSLNTRLIARPIVMTNFSLQILSLPSLPMSLSDACILNGLKFLMFLLHQFPALHFFINRCFLWRLMKKAARY